MKILTLGDLELYFQDLGTGYPVVLVHGMGSDHTIWEGIIPLLQEQYRVLAVDLRGHGISSKAPGPYSMGLFSQDIYGFLESLDIDQAHFMGHSMGGAVLQELVIQKPDIFSSLILISSFAYVDHHLRVSFMKLLKILREDGFNAFFNACLKLVYSPQYIQKNAELISEIRDIMAKTSSITSLEDTINACLKVNFIDSLKRVKTPTLVVSGKEDVFIPVYHGIKIKNSIFNSKIDIMAAASHNMLLEQPLETYRIIKNFLNLI
jgi:3-oxoadipate enol-lactonase